MALISATHPSPLLFWDAILSLIYSILAGDRVDLCCKAFSWPSPLWCLLLRNCYGGSDNYQVCQSKFCIQREKLTIRRFCWPNGPSVWPGLGQGPWPGFCLLPESHLPPVSWCQPRYSVSRYQCQVKPCVQWFSKVGITFSPVDSYQDKCPKVSLRKD